MLQVTPGEILRVVVGQGGQGGVNTGGYGATSPATFGGGGAGRIKSGCALMFSSFGAGGGRSAIQRNNEDIITAGGGDTTTTTDTTFITHIVKFINLRN